MFVEALPGGGDELVEGEELFVKVSFHQFPSPGRRPERLS